MNNRTEIKALNIQEDSSDVVGVGVVVQGKESPEPCAVNDN